MSADESVIPRMRESEEDAIKKFILLPPYNNHGYTNMLQLRILQAVYNWPSGKNFMNNLHHDTSSTLHQAFCDFCSRSAI